MSLAHAIAKGGLVALLLLLFAPTALAQIEGTCFGEFNFEACEQAHHDPSIAVIGGAVTVVTVATGVAVAGPALFPWAKGTHDSDPLEGEEEAEPELEDEPLADPFDGRLLPVKKGALWWRSAWIEEESAEERVEDARRRLADRDAQRRDLATEGGR